MNKINFVIKKQQDQGEEHYVEYNYLVCGKDRNGIMSVPSKAKAIKLDNPAQKKVSRQSGTELHIVQGNEHYEAVGMAIYQPQRK